MELRDSIVSPSKSKVGGETQDFSHPNDYDKSDIAGAQAHEPLTYAIALGVKSGGRGRVPSSSKVWGRSEIYIFQKLKKCFEWHIIPLDGRNGGERKLHLGTRLWAYHTAPFN